MRVLLAIVLLFALVASGCARKKAAQPHNAGSARAGTAAAPSETALAGEVSTVNPVARFVVLSFPLGQMPAIDQHLNLYRRGAKVAEVKVTGQQRGINIIADIVTGAPEVGDEARAD
jgi:hypothetical protein